MWYADSVCVSKKQNKWRNKPLVPFPMCGSVYQRGFVFLHVVSDGGSMFAFGGGEGELLFLIVLFLYTSFILSSTVLILKIEGRTTREGHGIQKNGKKRKPKKQEVYVFGEPGNDESAQLWYAMATLGFSPMAHTSTWMSCTMKTSH